MSFVWCDFNSLMEHIFGYLKQLGQPPGSTVPGNSNPNSTSSLSLAVSSGQCFTYRLFFWGFLIHQLTFWGAGVGGVQYQLSFPISTQGFIQLCCTTEYRPCNPLPPPAPPVIFSSLQFGTKAGQHHDQAIISLLDSCSSRQLAPLTL